MQSISRRGFGHAAAATIVAACSAPAMVASAPAARADVTRTAPLTFGVATPGGPLAGSELDAVTALAGEAPRTIMMYKDFQQAPPVRELQAAAARGAVPLVTWEPWAWGGGLVQPAYATRRIARGAFDSYLTSWGHALAQFGGPVLLRFAHEMNANWYPWCVGVNGTTATSYVAAWQHVRSVVRAAGATNVHWVWCPNAPYPGSAALPGIFPGAAAVDRVGLDSYNWGTSQSWSSWLPPEQAFGPGLGDLRSVAPGIPIIIAETASAEQGGSKPDWIAAAIAYLTAQADVTGFVWFDMLKEADWRIDSTTASAQALAAALAARR